MLKIYIKSQIKLLKIKNKALIFVVVLSLGDFE